MTSKENLISNISYTNKDFQSIYPALLDLVKKITYRWDPSISNESDPGVILLKLNAIIADKCNYNIDKNVLECFPLSVTQDRNARQLYSQLGYYMHWRLGATTQITLRWVGEHSSSVVTIPKFTMVTDSESSIVYTITEEAALPMDGSYSQFEAMQGVAVDYSLNGSKLITSENLDSNNRIYFEYNDVAENGIFIRNSSSINYSDWVKVDNLLTEEVSAVARNYSFGVTQDTNVCYIEFPENAQTLIGEGIYITYLKTNGSAGNIAPFTLEKFYNDISVPIGGVSTLLSSDNVQIINYYPATNGQDPESINDAYRGYKRTVGTFDTLITLRDYINAIVNSPRVSNAFVCDRTNDIQSSYDIISTENNINQLSNVVVDDLMTPFDLKFYMLYAVSESNAVSSVEQFNNTFRLLDDMDRQYGTSLVSDSLTYIADKKHISHNYVTLTAENKFNGDSQTYTKYKFGNQICLIKNKYPISGIIIPQYKLTSAQIDDIKYNIQQALLKALNSSQIEFGEEMDYDYVYSTIANADERIKSIILDDLSYQTYAIYMNVGNNTSSDFPVFEEIRIDDAQTDPSELSKQLMIDIAAKSVLAGNTQLFIEDDFVSPQIGQDWKKLTPTSFSAEVQEVETHLAKSFEKDANTNTYTYQVKQNESITLYTPNLIDLTEYTSYVKYEYYIHNNINANESYKLSAGEQIAFYWSSDDDGGYNYALYGQDSIIKPTFLLEATSTNTIPIQLQNMLESSTDIPKYIRGLTYSLPSASEIEEHIASLSTSNSTLTTTKYITVQSLNELTLNSSNCYCSWILNTTDAEGNYVLFGSNQSSYRLKSGEYFLYTNSTKSSLVILGVGTSITRSGDWTEPWKCASYDYSDIVTDGLNAIVNTSQALQRIKEGCEITVTENQFITLNEGATLKLVANQGLATEPTITSEEDIELASSEYSSIEYKGKSDAAFTQVPLVLLGGEVWKLHSRLNINTSESSPQLFTTGQSIKLYAPETAEVSEVVGTDNGVYLMSSSNIFVDGDAKIDVSYLNSSGEVLYPTMYAYSKFESTDTVFYGTSGTTEITLTDATTSANISLNFPPGKYVLTLFHSNSSLNGLNLNYNGNNLTRVGTSDSDLSQPSTYYLDLEISASDAGAQSLQINVVPPGAGSWTGRFYISGCYKYEINNDIISSIENSGNLIFEKVKALNVNNLYDYTYQAEEDELIPKPLSSLAFFNTHHIFNPFTIAQLDTMSLDNIYISNRVRS